MSYVKAEQFLPNEIIELIQEYVDGQSIYIPRKNQRLQWGTRTNSRQELSIRNESIYQDFLEGVKIKVLSKKYFLSTKSIQRIIRNKKIESNESIS